MFFNFKKKIYIPPQSQFNTGASYKNFRHLENDLLYTNNEYALNFLKNESKNENEEKIEKSKKIKWHAYWHGDINEKHIFSIKSLLCSQKNAEVYLWIDKNGFNKNKKNKFLKEIEHDIYIYIYEDKIQIKDTPFEKYKNIFLQNENLPARADAFRLLIPFKYGGLYFDLDVLFLRDFSDLLKNSFCYQWENQPYANTAISFFNKDIINKCLTYIEKYKTVVPWAVFNYANADLSDMTVFPCAFFDPIWNIGDINNYDYPITKFEDLFTEYKNKPLSYKEFFKGVYAFHWHNQWNRQIDKASLFAAFNYEFSEILNTKSDYRI